MWGESTPTTNGSPASIKVCRRNGQGVFVVGFPGISFVTRIRQSKLSRKSRQWWMTIKKRSRDVQKSLGFKTGSSLKPVSVLLNVMENERLWGLLGGALSRRFTIIKDSSQLTNCRKRLSKYSRNYTALCNRSSTKVSVNGDMSFEVRVVRQKGGLTEHMFNWHVCWFVWLYCCYGFVGTSVLISKTSLIFEACCLENYNSYIQCCNFKERRPIHSRSLITQKSPAIADKPARCESLPKIAPIRRAYNVVADNTGLSSCV